MSTSPHMKKWTHIAATAAQIVVPETGLKTTLLLDKDGLRVMGFGFAAGHELKAHTAPRPVVLHFLEGEAEVTLDGQHLTAHAGDVLHIPAHMTHAITAKTVVRMLLELLPA